MKSKDMSKISGKSKGGLLKRLIQKFRISSKPKEINGGTSMGKGKGAEGAKFRWWCETCKTGTHDLETFEKHQCEG